MFVKLFLTGLEKRPPFGYLSYLTMVFFLCVVVNIDFCIIFRLEEAFKVVRNQYRFLSGMIASVTGEC